MEQAPVERQVRARVVGRDPNFAEFADRLRPGVAPPNHELVIAVSPDMYESVVREMNRRRHEQQLRPLRIDPRGVPFLAVQAPLVPIAVVFGAVAIVVVVAAAAVAVAASAPAAAAVATGAVVAETGAAVTATTATGVTLTLIQGGGAAVTGGAAVAGGTAAASGVAVSISPAAAAGIAATVALTAHVSRAEAATGVRQLVGRNIAVVLDVTNTGGHAAIGKPGQRITAPDGNTYYPIVLLRSDEP